MHQDFGFQELYIPETEPEVDIIAVHGLNGDGKKTWTSASSNVCWLNHPDLLPKYVKNARVLTFTYPANITSVTGRKTSSDRIMQLAQTLVAELCADRELENATKRPIVFVCHSLGGIVVKRALSYSASRTAKKIAFLHSIYTCTFGILFFGVPHAGSSYASPLSSLIKITSFIMPRKIARIESGLVKALQEQSETFQDITDNFAPLLPKFHICFLWEQNKTNIGYRKDYIVKESSAAPIVDDTERSGIAANHREMCKFKDERAPGFRLVASILQRYCANAPEIIKARVGEAERRLQLRMLHDPAELHVPLHNPGISRDQLFLPNPSRVWTKVTSEYFLPQGETGEPSIEPCLS